MKVKIEVEFDTKDDRDELEELIEQLQTLRDVMSREGNFDFDDWDDLKED